MKEYIERNAAIEAMGEDIKNYRGFMAEEQFTHEDAKVVLTKVPTADVVEKETVRQAFVEACQECRDTCEEFDGFYADCNQCLLHGVKEKLKGVLEVAEQ